MLEGLAVGIIFISYSHDSPAHAERVLSFSERLRKDGYETSLDQYCSLARYFRKRNTR